MLSILKNAGDEEVYISSADWMERNLYRRVEACTPIEQQSLKERIINDLEICLQDNTQAWILNGEGKYTKTQPKKNKEPFAAQQKFLELFSDTH